ncbi:MAG TPA: hypothetical protein VGI66_05640, partial [Streptosporangiaceae bacterium]
GTMARSSGGRRMGRLGGCLVMLLALLVILLVLSILFGGFQRGTKAGGAGPVQPTTSSLITAAGS